MSHALSFEIAGSGGIIGGAGGGGGAPAGPSFGALVDGGGGADYTTIQDAINDNLKMFYVKGGQTYTENLTLDETCQRLILGPGTVISGTIDFSSGIENVIIKGGPGCQITGLITFAGSNTGCAITGENGFAIDAGIDVDCVSFFCDLGGWDSVITTTASNEGLLVSLTSTDTIIKSATFNGASGGAGANHNIDFNAPRGVIQGTATIDSDNRGFNIEGGAVDFIGVDNLILDTDNHSMLLGTSGGAQRGILSNNNVRAGGVHGLTPNLNADDGLVNNNIVDDVTNDEILIASGANDTLAYGNRVSGVVTDSDGTGTLAANDINAF